MQYRRLLSPISSVILLSMSSQDDQQADIAKKSGDSAARITVPVGGKEGGAREVAHIEKLLAEIHEEQEISVDQESVEHSAETEPYEELVEIRQAPEEQQAEIPPDLTDIGMQAVPSVVPPAIGDDDDVVVLPLTEAEIEEGLHHKVKDSIRWLAEWCKRFIKTARGNVKYADES